MQAYLKLLSLLAVATIAAYLASRALVPDAVPPGDSDQSYVPASPCAQPSVVPPVTS